MWSRSSSEMRTGACLSIIQYSSQSRHWFWGMEYLFCMNGKWYEKQTHKICWETVLLNGHIFWNHWRLCWCFFLKNEFHWNSLLCSKRGLIACKLWNQKIHCIRSVVHLSSLCLAQLPSISPFPPSLDFAQLFSCSRLCCPDSLHYYPTTPRLETWLSRRMEKVSAMQQ